MIAYNYNFLREWMSRTATTQRELMRAVGNSSGNNIHDWLGDGPAQKRQAARGEPVRPVAMNTESMVRFCNYFDLPVGVFFLKDGRPMAEAPDKVWEDLDKRLRAIEDRLHM